jgi:hypothetical protein
MPRGGFLPNTLGAGTANYAVPVFFVYTCKTKQYERQKHYQRKTAWAEVSRGSGREKSFLSNHKAIWREI